MNLKELKEATEQDIKEVKALRVAIDANIQVTKNLDIVAGIPEKVIALRKLQEAKMWLGQALAELGATNPYPHADNPNNAKVSPTADVSQKR